MWLLVVSDGNELGNCDFFLMLVDISKKKEVEAAANKIIDNWNEPNDIHVFSGRLNEMGFPNKPLTEIVEVPIL